MSMCRALAFGQTNGARRGEWSRGLWRRQGGRAAQHPGPQEPQGHRRQAEYLQERGGEGSLRQPG